MLVPFATNSYKHDSLPISAQRTVNLYAEAQPKGAKTAVSVHGAPGIVTYAEAGTGPIRGARLVGGVLYVVSGPWLYSITDDATPVVTRLGGQISGSGVVHIEDNGTQIVMVNGSNGYVYSTSSGFQLITDTDFHAANTVTFLDQFFLFDWAATNKFFRSDLLDGTAYDSTAFASAESKSDNVLGVQALKQVLWVFGEASMEPWHNAGAANFPWERVPGGTIDRGILAANAHAMEDDGLFLIGEDRIGYRLGGSQLQRNTTHAIERAWQKYATVTDAFGLSHTWNGHKFISFTFPTQSTTWVYDIATQLWHERESRDRSGNPLGRWRANCIVEAYGKTFVGDAYTGKVGYLDDTVFTEFGDPIYCEAVGPTIHANGKRIFINEFRLDMETGVGLTSGQGSDPQVMLDVSEDGGRTWSDMQPWQDLGKIGATKTQLFWQRLGSCYQWTPRITISDPVRRAILEANLEMKVGL